MINYRYLLPIVCSLAVINVSLAHPNTSKTWNEVDIIIDTNDQKIGGTLIVPKVQKSNSLVIMSSGSGPQDRDETLFGFKIFKEIAEHLASNGIASFRYDDRGIGDSTGDFVNSTIDDLTRDVDVIMHFFKTYKLHPFNEFALFGHSQGGLIAAKAAVGNNSVKQLILMASPSVPLVEVVLAQVRSSYASTDIALIEGEVSAHNQLMSALNNDKDVEKAVETFERNHGLLLSNLTSTDSLGAVELERKVNEEANELKIIYRLPSLASFLYYDPTNDLQHLSIPVLGLFGGRDAQVSITQNKDRMESALLKSRTKYHFSVLNEANHFFQKSDTGLKREYDGLEKEFVDGFLDEISTWLLKN